MIDGARSAAFTIVVAFAYFFGLSARASAKLSDKVCRYEIVKAPFLRELKPLPRAPFSGAPDAAFAGQTFLALYRDEATDRWHLVAWDSLTKQPRVLITQKGDAYGPLAPAPDGHRVAMMSAAKDGRAILVYDLATGALSTIAFEKYALHLIPHDPIWDPTGKFLAVSLEGFIEAAILPRRVRVYEVQSGRRIRDTPPALDVELELWDREGLLVRRKMPKEPIDYDDPAYAYRFWRLASIDAGPKALRSVPLRSPDGKIDLQRSRRGVQIRDGDSACLLELDLGRDDPKPTDVTWLSGDRLLLSDKDGNTWLVDPRARRAQPLADPDTGTGWFDGRDLVFHLRDGSFASASIGP